MMKGNQNFKVCWNLSYQSDRFHYRSDRLDLFQNKSGPLDLSGPLPGLQRGFPDMSSLSALIRVKSSELDMSGSKAGFTTSQTGWTYSRITPELG
jgi:hypothetical protein